MYNFDEVIDRRGTGSAKWNQMKEGVIPLWVADMDFPAFPELREALVRRAEHPFYGYRDHDEAYFEAILDWYRLRHNLTLDREELLSAPGTVLALGMVVREWSREGDGVLILTPVYTPFFDIIRENKRRPVEVPLNSSGGFPLDLDRIEAALVAAEAEGIKTPLALLCSPHNPGGRVWKAEEIAAFLSLMEKRNMICAVDEIHCDFVWSPGRFVSAASLERYRDRVITVSGATKTFNLGGLHVSHLVIRDQQLRRIMRTTLHRESHHEGDVFAELAVKTAYRFGAPWLDELRPYLERNIHTAANFLGGEIPGVRTFIPGGTYLLWADMGDLIARMGCRDDRELAKRLEEEAAVKITPGGMYGKAGEGFMRINIAGPRSILEEGLRRIRDWAARFQ